MANGRTILVTGGAGYIGSHVCKMLAQSGYNPVAYDNLSRGHRWAVKWGSFEKGDIGDHARLTEVMEKYRPEAVMHFAAYAYVGESVEKPGIYYRNNVAGTLTLLEVMNACQVDRLIFSSSCAVYGVPETVPMTESHPRRPINPYGRSKCMVEQMLHDFNLAYDLTFVSLRYFNAAGADGDTEIGEVHEPETHLIPLILETAAGKRPHVIVHGDDYETPDGTCIRDFIHVTDLAKAHVLALGSLKSGWESSAYNLGNGAGFSVREVIETAKKVTGRNANVVVGPRRPGDPARLVGDASKAAKTLNWKPEYPLLADIIETAWKWTLHYASRL